jgi:hypothetical protein
MQDLNKDLTYINTVWYLSACNRSDIQGVKNMITEKIRQTVMTRYGKFAETGGNKESC